MPEMKVVEMPSAGMERRPKLWALGLLGLMLAGLMLTAKPAHADTFIVTNAADPGDGFCNAQGCTLREAIEVANARSGADVIKFNIAGGGVKTITPESELPAIIDPVTIDGYSQPGSRPNSRATGAIDAVILVELSGINAGSGADGLKVVAPNVVVRGLVINRFAVNGINISGGTGTRIEGNFIGTNASGTLDLGNGGDGVDIKFGTKNTIGGTTPASRNLISGNVGGVRVNTGSTRVQGNLIGVTKDANSPLGGSQVGVEVLASNNTIGGAEPGAGNVIANSLGVGVFLSGGTSTRILSNSIFSNGSLGIDLTGDGRTLNDLKDPDSGPNNRQNFPELASAEKVSEKTIIEGRLDSTPSTKRKKRSFTIQFFSNPQNEDEGKTFLGQKRVTTNRQGLVSFAFENSRPLALEDRITATATDARGNTSEFSDPEVVDLPGLE